MSVALHVQLFARKLILIFMLIVPALSFAAKENFTFKSPDQDTQYHRLIEEFRCPKCQNANLAGSDAPIAQDLKQKTYELVQAGQSDQEIRAYMVTRYGDFISYKPPIKPSTWLLWFTPPSLLIVGAMTWLLRTRRRRVAITPPLSSEETWRLSQLLNSSNPSLSAPAASLHDPKHDQEQAHDR